MLDVGLGSAFYVALYRELGISGVHGVDISPTAVERARSELPAYDFAVCDISAGLPADIDPETGFDWVSAMDMLYHLVEEELFFEGLRHCGRAVRPGGCLIISDNFPVRTTPTTAHQAFHSLEDYKRVLTPLGLQLVEVSPVFFASNGQVGCDAATYRLMWLYWQGFSRVLGKSVHTWRAAGEALGEISGCLLTNLDVVLQHQHRWRGYSLKTAVFRRPGH